MRGLTKRRMMFSVAGFLLAVCLFGAAPVAAAGDTGRGTVDNAVPHTSGDPHDKGFRDGGDDTITPDLGNVRATQYTGAVGITAWDLIIRYGAPNDDPGRISAGYNRPIDPARSPNDVTLRP